MTTEPVAIIGASSMVGHHALEQFKHAGVPVVALSRRPHALEPDASVTWANLSGDWARPFQSAGLKLWLCVCPIACIADYFSVFEKLGARRIVVLSSTSRFTKSASAGSSDPYEHALVKTLEDSEEQFKQWATATGVEWVILRPTLIYDGVRDKNISTIASFISRYGFFPLLGKAQGLRQPVFAGDVASAGLAALTLPAAGNHDFNIAGGETLTYMDMVRRIFAGVGRKPRFFSFPLVAFKLALRCAKYVPRYRNLSLSMAMRMNQDMVFDNSKAQQILGYSPKRFLVDKAVLPQPVKSEYGQTRV